MVRFKSPTCLAAKYSDDGSQLVVVGVQGAVALNPNTGKRLWRTRPFAHVGYASFSHNGAKVVAKSTSGEIALLDAFTGSVLRLFQNQSEGEGCEVCFSPCDDFLVDGSWSGVVTVRSVASGQIELREEVVGSMVRRISHDKASASWLFQYGRPDYCVVRSWPFNAPHTVVPGEVGSNATIAPDGLRYCYIDVHPAQALCVASIRDGKVLARSEDAVESGGTGNELSWSDDGTIIASVQRRGFVFYDATNLSVLGKVDCEYPAEVAWKRGGEQVALATWSGLALTDRHRLQI